MNKKYFIILSVIVFFISYSIYILFNEVQNIVAGGYATIEGFPIPYYYDIWTTTAVEHNRPWFKHINFPITFLVIYLPVLLITRGKWKSNSSG